MRRPSPFTQQHRDFDVKLTPLIDVVFLLMVFFIWTSSFTLVERALPSRVSSSASGAGQPVSNEPPPPEADFDAVVVRVLGSQGNVTWQLRGKPVASLTELLSRLRPIAEVNPAAPVIVHPDADTPLGQVIDVYDLARQAGFTVVKMATH